MIYCTVCGVEVSRENTVIVSTGHTIVVDTKVEATCTLSGLTEGSHCSVCNTVLVSQTPINALGHDYETIWSSNDEYHWHECSRCSDFIDKAAHTYGDYTVTLEPTYDSTGTKERTCSACSHKDEVIIDKLTFDVTTISFVNINVSYTGEAHSVYATNIPTGVNVVYEGNGVVEVGTYTVTAKFYTNDSILLGELTAVITISSYDVVLPPIE